MSAPPPSAPSPILSLPPELRLQIYTLALAPTTNLFLTSTPVHRRALIPHIAPALLCTNRQIHAEATPLLYLENTPHIILDAHETAWPIIAESRLPQHVLGKLVKLEVLLDCSSATWGSPQRVFGNVDFSPLGALGGLRELRVRVLVQEMGKGWLEGERVEGWVREAWGWLAREVLERVGEGVVVRYGPEEGEGEGREDGRFPMSEIVAKRERTVGGRVVEVPGEMLERGVEDAFSEEEMMEFRIRRGSKSGGVADVWGEWREWERQIRGE